jgi:hypothetical protein
VHISRMSDLMPGPLARYVPAVSPAVAEANRKQWISWFLSSKGNEYFCEVEEDYILDRFNLTGLNTEVANYQQALDLITDNLGTLASIFLLPPLDARQKRMRMSRMNYEARWMYKRGCCMGSYTRVGSQPHAGYRRCWTSTSAPTSVDAHASSVITRHYCPSG